MKIHSTVPIVALALSLIAPVYAQQPEGSVAPKPAAAQAPATIAKVVDREIASVEKDFVSAAEAMPAEKYNFAPAVSAGDFKGVRTFAEQVRHVAQASTILWSAALGEKPNVNTKEDNGPASMTSKDDIVKFLKDSFALGHRAAAALTTENLLERTESDFGKAPRVFWATDAVAHAYDHYGQMVEYLRMNGIVPPSSRPATK